MNRLSDMYGQQYTAMGHPATMVSYGGDDGMGGVMSNSMDANMMGQTQTQTLDQIVNQNNQEMMRRRRTFQPSYRPPNGPVDHSRRASMLEFTSSSSSDLADFQFDPNPHQIVDLRSQQKAALDPRKVRSREDLSLDTQFHQMNNFDNMQNSTSYQSSMMPNSAPAMDNDSPFLLSNMDMSADFDTVGDMGQLGMGSNPSQQNMYSTSPMATNFSVQYPSSSHDPGGGSANSPRSKNMGGASSSSSTPQRYPNKTHQQLRRGAPMMPSPLSMSTQDANMQSMASAQNRSQQPRSRRQSMEQPMFMNNQSTDMAMEPLAMQTHNLPSRYQSAYSSSGFDMLGVLMRVATRPNPQINIGPVDLSCAFVVCDIEKHDFPIVYCSDMFERLTGYTRHEILGRNCRFLQAPDGKVRSGVKRKYVDDKSVLYLKNKIQARAEAQLSLINYRKGGQPFMNLLTMIPISWDTEEYKYFVGFQVDLVEQPNSVSAKNPDGTYEINYNRSALPAYRLPQPDPSHGIQEMGGQTIPRDEVSQVLATIGNGETELSRRIWDKVLLENTDDVVHVLSLKGLFLYLSPACKNILEYEPSELVGTALSAVCHPSDIVPVTRELKDSSSGAAVNVVYRIRRKNSGYTWFEAHGCLHTEQGKGRKCIILVGRQRPVFALDKNDITADGGAGDSELWSKMSTTGMFLYVSSNARSMLDRLPDDLVGTSMQSLMRPESKKEFGRVLEVARLGHKSTFKHDLQNRRGQVLQAQTTVYPGDARKGFKPTFLLAQTCLLKMTRAMLLTHKTGGSLISGKTDQSMGSNTPLPHANQSQTTPMSPSAIPSIFTGESGILTQAGSSGVAIGNQDELLASDDNIFDELKTTRSTSWQFELRQMQRQNRLLAEELQALLSRKKKRKRRKGLGQLEKDCANCHTRVTPEWRRGPSGQRDLCNSCGLRWAKQNGRVSPRKGSGVSDKSSTSPVHAANTNTNPSNSKENSTESNPTTVSGSATATPLQAKMERDTSKGTMPPSIAEGQEPPHRNVLPT